MISFWSGIKIALLCGYKFLPQSSCDNYIIQVFCMASTPVPSILLADDYTLCHFLFYHSGLNTLLQLSHNNLKLAILHIFPEMIKELFKYFLKAER